MTTEPQTIHLTETGRARLQDELQRLRSEHEPASRERLREARESGLTDDAERHLAVDELLRIQSRIDELEQLLAASAGAPPPVRGAATIGSRVTARDEDGRLHTFVLVSPLEAGTVPGHISTGSPVGAALTGRAAGDAVKVTVPAGLRTFTVVSVE